MIKPPHTEHWFACGWFAQWMSTLGGRLGRTVAGIALIAAGLAGIGGWPGIAVALVGVVPLVAGLFDLCIFSALLGGPLHGSAIRTCSRRAR